MNEVNKNQFAIIVMLLPLIFKATTLPALLYRIAGNMASVSAICMLIMEFLQLGLIIFIVRNGGIEGIKENYGMNVARAVALPLLLSFLIKAVLYLLELVNYTATFHFYDVSYFALILVSGIVIFYLGIKGMKTVARIFEIFIWFIPLIILMGLLFGGINVQANYLTPFFADGFTPVAKSIGVYLIYCFDFSPFLFIRMKRDNKKPFILIGIIFSFVLMISYYVVFIGSYGRAAGLFQNAYGTLSTFDIVISEIGSLQWPSAMLLFGIAFGNIALKICGISEIMRLFQVRKKVSVGVATAIIVLLSLTVFSTLDKVVEFVTGAVRYVIFAIEVLVPILIFTLIVIHKKRQENGTPHPAVTEQEETQAVGEPVKGSVYEIKGEQ